MEKLGDLSSPCLLLILLCWSQYILVVSGWCSVPIKSDFFLCYIPRGPINVSPFGCWSQVIWGPVLLVAVTKALHKISVQAPCGDILATWHCYWSGLEEQALGGVCRLS